MKLIKNMGVACFFSVLCLLLSPSNNAFSMEREDGEKLTSVIRKIAENDPSVTSIRFWNIRYKEDQALKQLFKALENNKHVESIEISFDAFKDKTSVKLCNECLKKYNNNVPKNNMTLNGTWMWQANNSVVGEIAKTIKNNTSLKTVCFKHMWISQASRKVLGDAFRDNQSINKLILQIDGLNTDLTLPIVRNPRIKHLDLSGNPFLSAINDGFLEFIDEIIAQNSIQALCLKDSYDDCYGAYQTFGAPPTLSKLLLALNDENHCLEFLDIKEVLEESKRQAGIRTQRMVKSGGFRPITNQQFTEPESPSLKRTVSEEENNNQKSNKKVKK